MDKPSLVKLPRETIKAIEDKLSKGLSPEEFVEYHATGKGKWDNSYLNTLTLDEVIRALYIGHEVEQTPEDKVREWIAYHKDNAENGRSGTAKIMYMVEGALELLDILNIKIKGVND